MVFSGLFDPGMFGSELDLCREVAILTLYRQAIPIWSVGGSETIVNMIFERFRTSRDSGDEGKAVCGGFQGGRMADRLARGRKFRPRANLSAVLPP